MQTIIFGFSYCTGTHHHQSLLFPQWQGPLLQDERGVGIFIEAQKKWFFRVDNDNYLNVPKLLQPLFAHGSDGYWYLGKPSMNVQLQISHEKTNAVFATGCAGFARQNYFSRHRWQVHPTWKKNSLTQRRNWRENRERVCLDKSDVAFTSNTHFSSNLMRFYCYEQFKLLLH